MPFHTKGGTLARRPAYLTENVRISDSSFTLSIVPDRARVHVRPGGDVDLSTSGEVERAVCELLERGFGCVVIDLREVTFMDCSGDHALLNAGRRARGLGARMTVLPGDGPARRLLALTGVDDHLDLERAPALAVG
jgi:anti-sigma B factor antagonist